MAEFEGSYEETFTVDVPIESAKKHYGGLDAIIAAYPGLDRGEKVDDKTIHFRLKPKSALGAEFRGEYKCQYTFPTDTRLEWRTLGKFNINAYGHIEFKSLGERRTQCTYQQHLTLDMPVNFLVAKAIGPIVKKSIADGAKEYLAAMRSTLPKD